MLHLYKYHGLGNDYLIYDPDKNGTPLTPALVRYLCNRNLGAGADGILYGPVTQKNSLTNTIDYSLTIYNPDGSIAEKSGNGIRIFCAYLKDFGYVLEDEISLITLGGNIKCQYINGDSCHTKIFMGIPSTNAKTFPVVDFDGEILDYDLISKPLSFNNCLYYVTCVNIGNPHCVIPLVNISKDLALKLGPSVEKSPYFPNKINMQLMKVMDSQNIAIEIYERGAGYTLASGSSSCAAAYCAYLLGLTENKIKVHMPGGNLDIEITDYNEIYMSGKVKYVGEFFVVKETSN